MNEALRLKPKGEPKPCPPHSGLATPTQQAIYVLGRDCGTAVKIGWSKKFTQRIYQHREEASRYDFDWKVLAVVHGTRADEKRVQGYFSDQALKAEQEYFSVDTSTPNEDPLLRWVHWLRDQWFVAVDDERPHVETIPSEAWVPGPGREKDFTPTLPFGPWSIFQDRVVTGDDYYTPGPLIEVIRAALGGIDLDPASHAVANSVIRARRFFSKADDGLKQKWSGNVWLNPPFSEWPSFASKVTTELHRVDQLASLASTGSISARYFRPILERCDVVTVLTGRLEFWGPQVDSGNGAGPGTGHVVLYFGQDANRFVRAMSHLGVCLAALPIEKGDVNDTSSNRET